MLMKRICNKCPKPAVWVYMPRYDDDSSYYCDDCVHRGCSCMLDESNEYLKDELGRALPCCEYDYEEDGYNDGS
jgi:hypothetical protein